MNCFVDGPSWVWHWGPIEIDYHRYCGPMFMVFGKCVYPRRYSPLWILWAVVRRKRWFSDE